MKYKGKEEHPSSVEEPDMAGTYTAADYLSWTFEGFVELIRGKIFKMSPAPTSNHQRVSARLLRVLLNFFQHRTCEVFHAPFDVYLVKPGQDFKKTANVLQPDICIVCDPKKIRKEGCVGAPDVVIEILSPSNTRKDVDYKFSLYEEYGVPEYWMIHPGEGTVIVNVLENGSYRTMRPVAAGQSLDAQTIPGLSVDLEEIFNRLESY